MDTAVTNCVIARTDAGNESLRSLMGYDSTARALEALTSVVLRDPRWASRQDLTFVLKHAPAETILAAFGTFDESDLQRIASLASQLKRAAAGAIYVDYRQAEQDCEVLAAQLKTRYGHDELRRFSYVPIPRGGTLVLGMLGYALDLPSASLGYDASPERPVVVVDDCALSGVRFGQVLPGLHGNEIIYTPLYSHEGLRQTINEREPRVLDCVSARDLTDLAPKIHGDGYPVWKENWTRRLGRQAYWIGDPEYLCFAWSEPESSFWNGATEAIEPGWKFLPPERCLKHRVTEAPSNRPTDAPSLRILPRPKGPLKPADNAIYARQGNGKLAVALPPDPDCFLFDDVAAAMWEALVRFGEIPPAATSLAQQYEVEPGRLEADLTGFVEDLEKRGLFVTGDR